MAFSPNNFPALLKANKELAAENERLRAEVARLTKENNELGGVSPVKPEEEENDDAY